jgi:hypothetical protein
MKYAGSQPPIFRDGGTQAVRVDPHVKFILYSLVAGMVAMITIALSVSHVL